MKQFLIFSLSVATLMIASKSLATSPQPLVLTTYRGTTTFADGSTRPVQIVLFTSGKFTAECAPSNTWFHNCKLPMQGQQDVQASFNYGGSANILANNAVLNSDNRLTLRATVAVTGSSAGSYFVALNCTFSTDSIILNCQHLSSQMTVANTVATLEASPTQNNGDYNSDLLPISKVFKGSGPFLGKTIEIDVVVTKPGKTRLQDVSDLMVGNGEEYLNASVKFYFDPSEPNLPISSDLPSLKWDAQTKELSGIQLVNDGNEANYLSLICAKFNFDKPQPFTCDYSNGKNIIPIVVSKP